MVSITGVTIIRQTVKAVAGESRNISVTAAEGNQGLNGTLPRRVTLRTPKVRRYAHFDDPLTLEDLQKFKVEPGQVKKHSFLPLLGYQKIARKIDFSVFPPIVKNKERDIRYASHTDSAIYSQYARQLSSAYEDVLAQEGLGEVVLAYRGGIGYNVPFARSLIDEILARKSCVVICLDVSGFFDHLVHIKLRSMLCEVLGCDKLSDDWFKIFTRLTKFEYVLRESLEAKIGKVRRRRLCEIDTFRRIVRPIIKKNDDDFGIPQGTPLSGLFANVYMLGFDKKLNEYVKSVGGSYRRYSDDIAIVLPEATMMPDLMCFVDCQIGSQGLEFNKRKTCISMFSTTNGIQSCSGDVFQYLGFIFDGQKVLIRPESIKNFYAKMKGNISRYVRAAARKGIPLMELRKRVLIGRFTHWGDNKNFVQYAYRAAKELNAPEIKRQLRNHVSIFDRQWAKMVEKCAP